MKMVPVRIYHNPKWYTPLGAMKERNERDDARLWEGKPSYQDELAKRIEDTKGAHNGQETH